MVHLRQQQQLQWLNHILRQERSKVKCFHSDYLLTFSQSLASHGCVVTLAVWYFYTGASTSDLCRNWHLLTTRKSSYFFSKTNTWLSSEVCTINIVCYLGAYYCTSSLLYQLVQGRWVGDSLVQASEFKHLFWSFYVWRLMTAGFFGSIFSAEMVNLKLLGCLWSEVHQTNWHPFYSDLPEEDIISVAQKLNQNPELLTVDCGWSFLSSLSGKYWF